MFGDAAGEPSGPRRSVRGPHAAPATTTYIRTTV